VNIAAVNWSSVMLLLASSSFSRSTFSPETPLCLPALESNSTTTDLNSSAVNCVPSATDMPPATECYASAQPQRVCPLSVTHVQRP
jgi:hypothetical protein